MLKDWIPILLESEYFSGKADSPQLIYRAATIICQHQIERNSAKIFSKLVQLGLIDIPFSLVSAAFHYCPGYLCKYNLPLVGNNIYIFQLISRGTMPEIKLAIDSKQFSIFQLSISWSLNHIAIFNRIDILNEYGSQLEVSNHDLKCCLIEKSLYFDSSDVLDWTLKRPNFKPSLLKIAKHNGDKHNIAIGCYLVLNKHGYKFTFDDTAKISIENKANIDTLRPLLPDESPFGNLSGKQWLSLFAIPYEVRDDYYKYQEMKKSFNVGNYRPIAYSKQTLQNIIHAVDHKMLPDDNYSLCHLQVLKLMIRLESPLIISLLSGLITEDNHKLLSNEDLNKFFKAYETESINDIVKKQYLEIMP